VRLRVETMWRMGEWTPASMRRNPEFLDGAREEGGDEDDDADQAQHVHKEF
jgi:hypothetical protein